MRRTGALAALLLALAPSAARAALARVEVSPSLGGAASAAAPSIAAPLGSAAAPLDALGLSALASVPGPKGPGSAPALDGDALFDGRAARPPLPAAADGPAPKPSAPAPGLRKGSRLSRWARVAGAGVPAAVAMGVAGRLAPHAALTAVHWIGQAAYWLANPFAFLFTMPQVHKMLARRSADVSAAMIAVGALAAALATLNFAYDGKTLMMARNLAQALGFAVMLVLRRVYSRSPGKAPPSRTRAYVETGLIAAGVTAVLFAAGPALMAAVQGIAAMNSLLVPLQVLSGFGFTYLMFAQLSKMRRANSPGDSSPAMMWAFLGTKTVWVWSLATMIGLATAPPWLTLPTAAAFIAACWIAGRAAIAGLLKAKWGFLPETVGFRGHALTRERLGDVGAFAALSALILLLSAGGYFAFVDVLGVPHAAAARFAMYLLYTVQSLIASLATLKSLSLQARFLKAQKP